jgi:hypothetical protein
LVAFYVNVSGRITFCYIPTSNQHRARYQTNQRTAQIKEHSCFHLASTLTGIVLEVFEGSLDSGRSKRVIHRNCSAQLNEVLRTVKEISVRHAVRALPLTTMLWFQKEWGQACHKKV